MRPWRGSAGECRPLRPFPAAPLGLVILFSFTDRTISNFPINALSLQWWDAMLANPQFLPALKNSLIIGAAVGVSSAVIGTMAAIGICAAAAAPFGPRHRSPLPAAHAAAAGAGRVASRFYVAVGLSLSLGTVILSHLLFTQPFVVIVVYARMA